MSLGLTGWNRYPVIPGILRIAALKDRHISLQLTKVIDGP